MTAYDLVVIGAGAGGLSAARTAADRGKRAALVTDGPIGGDCTWTGCVPSKTLIESAAAGASADAAFARIRRVVAHIASTEDADVLRGEGIDVIEGRGRFVPGGGVEVDGTRVEGSSYVIATGSRAAVPAVPGLDGPGVLTNESFFELATAPRSIVVMGGGPVGCELSQALARLGVEVTLVESADRVLLREEPEAAEVVADALRRSGVDVRLGQAVTAVGEGPDGTGVRVLVGESERVEAERVLVAVGREPVTDGLGIEEIGVRTDARGHIETDAASRTSVRGVYAVGDVTGKLPFTHAADEMGRLAAWTATIPLLRFRFRPHWIPWVTFTDPEVGRVGVTEAEAPANARVAYLPMSENDRAITADATEGFVKLIVGPRPLLRNALGGRVLGATIVAPRAGEMIHEPTLAMRTNMFAGRLAQTAHAYPSWSVGVQKAAAQLFREIEGRTARPVRSI